MRDKLQTVTTSGVRSWTRLCMCRAVQITPHHLTSSLDLQSERCVALLLFTLLPRFASFVYSAHSSSVRRCDSRVALHMSDASEVQSLEVLLACVVRAVVLDVSGLAAREARPGTTACACVISECCVSLTVCSCLSSSSLSASMLSCRLSFSFILIARSLRSAPARTCIFFFF